jgi:hypothetical protein
MDSGKYTSNAERRLRSSYSGNVGAGSLASVCPKNHQKLEKLHLDILTTA